MLNNQSDWKQELLKSKHLVKNINNWIKDENSLEDLKVSSSDINWNSLLRPNNLEYDIDDKENSILNHPNVIKSGNLHTSKDERVNTEEDDNLSKCQSKIKSAFQISQFLGSISKIDDGFTEKINQYMQKNNAINASPNFNDSKNYRELEMMLKTYNQSHLNKINDNRKENELDNSISGQDLLDADESFLKSKLQSSKRKDKRRMIREMLKK